MSQEHFHPSDKSPLQELVSRNSLKLGQRLVFNYITAEGQPVRFEGQVRADGIEVKGQRYSVSFSAIQCVKSVGDKAAINGWLAWETEEGEFLAELYQRMAGHQFARQGTRGFTEKFYKYPRMRDVVYVFGAGASYTAGAPLQRDIVPMILSMSDPVVRESLLFKMFTEFLRENFVWDEQARQYPSLERIFGFLDYFIQKKESLSQKYSLGNIFLIKEALIQLTHHVISTRASVDISSYRHFWEWVYRLNKNISIITLNYDTYLEDAFTHMYPRNLYLDYCLDLANYDHSEYVDDTNWWVNPREPILSLPAAEPLSVKLIKIHGSLNWKYCDCCNSVLLTPLDKKLDLGRGEPPWKPGSGHASTSMVRMRCNRDGNEYQTLLVPPSHMKDLSHPINSQLFVEASEEIRRARKIVFIGYSLPEADVHVKAVIRKSIRPGTPIVVINTDESQAFRLRYRELSEGAQFLKHSFEELVQDEAMMRSISAQPVAAE